jgi:hypothetical protein
MVLSNVNQTYIVKWLNKEKAKKSGEKFTSADVQGYVRRGRLPKYLGGNKIEKAGENCKSYNVID